MRDLVTQNTIYVCKTNVTMNLTNHQSLRSLWSIKFFLLILISRCHSFSFINTHRGIHSSAICSTRQPTSKTSSSSSITITRPCRTTKLFGITEWRDTMFDYLPGSSNDIRQLGIPSAIAPPKEICILPFGYYEVLVQGECKQLRLYEDRFIQLFHYSMKYHNGIVAMGLLANSGSIVETVPICEIEAYNTMNNNTNLGIFVTLRVVGRAKIIDFIQPDPFIKAVCEEIIDIIPPNLELPNLVASNIENLVLLLTSMEHRIQLAQMVKMENNTIDEDDDVNVETKEALEMKRRIQLAKLEDTFYDEDDDDDEEDDEEEDDDDDDIKYANRLKRFRRSCEIALNTDTQGYSIQLPSKLKNQSTSTKGKVVDDTLLSRSARELSAISWGTFCTDGPSNIMAISSLPKEQQNIIEKDNLETITYKIQALDCDKLFDRLNLGFHLLRRKKERLQIILKNLGMSTSRQETQDDDEDIDDLTEREFPIIERKTSSNNNNTQDRSNDDEDDNITIDSSDDKSNNKR